jgi:hypothetical protein
MTLNERKIQKGIAMNKFRKKRNEYGNVSYQQERRSNLVDEYTISLNDYEFEETKKPHKPHKKENKRIKIENKKDIMSDILEPIVDTKKKVIIEEIVSDESDEKQTGGGESNEKQIGGEKIFKKIFITANMEADPKKNELIL